MRALSKRYDLSHVRFSEQRTAMGHCGSKLPSASGMPHRVATKARTDEDAAVLEGYAHAVHSYVREGADSAR